MKEEEEYYKKAIEILDGFYEESLNEVIENEKLKDWRTELIFKLFVQSRNITFLLLSNTKGSKFVSDTSREEIIYVGALGRILRDIYVSIVYLKTNKYDEKLMKLCWEYQGVCQKIQLIQKKFKPDERFVTALEKQLNYKEELKGRIDNISFSTKGKVLDGKEEKMLSLEELAEIKGFNKIKFKAEFDFFSQFAHSTAFANGFTGVDGADKEMFVYVYHHIPAYYVGIVVETIGVIKPDHSQIDELSKVYKEIIKEKWN